MKLFIDVTRISTRVVGSAPTGIDRVEFAYATEIMENYRDLNPVSVITTPLFSGALRGSVTRDILKRVSVAWKLDLPPSQDKIYQSLKDYLESPIDVHRQRSHRVRGAAPLPRAVRQGFFPVRSLARASARLRRRVNVRAHRPSCYLNSSQTQLEKIERFGWTESAAIPCVFFIHDVIPIDYPEFVSPHSCERHEGRMETVGRLASAVIVNSEYTAQSVEAYLVSHGFPVPQIKVIPLGVTEWFTRKRRLEPPQPATPYFVAVSTIEPRKNFLFLFSVWRKLTEIFGVNTPRLVIVGNRGWENENVLDVLDRSRSLAPFLVEATDLSDSGLASLLRGATALLSPSTVEGYGLPVAEALSLGVPVIASDIAAHREVGRKHATYLDVIDGQGWTGVLRDFVTPDTNRREIALNLTRNYRATTLRDHVSDAVAFTQGAIGAA